MRRTHRARRSSVALAAALALASLSGPALAGPGRSVATYRDTVERGTAAFAAGRFDDARIAFEAAYEIHPDPVLVFNIASCWRRAGNSDQALVEYQRYLLLATDDGERRALAADAVASLEQAERTRAAVRAAPAAPAAAPAPRRSPLRPIGIGVASVGGAGAIVGLVELARASSPDQVALQPPSRKKLAAAPIEPATAPAGDGARGRAILLGVSGAALIAAGVTVYYLGRRAERRPLRLTVSGGGEGAAVLLGGRF